MCKTTAIAPQGVIALGDFVLNLERISDVSLTSAILVFCGLSRGFEQGKVFLPDLDHALGQRRHEQALRDFAA